MGSLLPMAGPEDFAGGSGAVQGPVAAAKMEPAGPQQAPTASGRTTPLARKLSWTQTGSGRTALASLDARHSSATWSGPTGQSKSKPQEEPGSYMIVYCFEVFNKF